MFLLDRRPVNKGHHLVRKKYTQNILCFFSPALENKSVVLASTAIQLLDDRKSPIVAGKKL